MEFPPIEVATWFAVPIGDAHVMGIVHRAGGDRVFCVMVGPPLRDGWQAEYESRWIVEDIALRDGSWRLMRRSDAFEPEPLPRFAGTSKDDAPVLAVYDLDSLHVVDIVQVTGDDQRAEWERAPRWLPTDVTAFEHALANTMEIAAPALQPHPYDDKAREDRLVVAMTRLNASDLSAALPLTHVVRFSGKKAARVATDHARTLAYDVRLDAPLFGGATLELTENVVPSYPAVRPAIHRARGFAEEFGGDYDGFEMAVR